MEVLVVDDNERFLGTTRRGLEVARIGHITCMSDPWDAFEHLLSHTVDIVIADVNMPGLTGIELYAKTHLHLTDAPPFILMTGNSAAIRNQLGVPVVVKPFGIFELVDRITDAIEADFDPGRATWGRDMRVRANGIAWSVTHRCLREIDLGDVPGA